MKYKVIYTEPSVVEEMIFEAILNNALNEAVIEEPETVDAEVISIETVIKESEYIST